MPQEGEMTDPTPAEPQEPEETQEPTEPEEPEDPANDPEDGGFDPEKAREKIRKINSENKNLRKRATDAEEKAKGADDKDKTITAQEAEIMRLRVAVKHGLPESLVKRLSGTTEEEILQDAEELMELFGSKKPPTQLPKEKLRSPGDPSGHADIDVEKVVRRVFEQ